MFWIKLYIPSTSSTDTQDLAASMKLILECYFKGFEKEYALAQEQYSEAALQRCSEEKVFWKYAANLQENTHAEMWFQ